MSSSLFGHLSCSPVVPLIVRVVPALLLYVGVAGLRYLDGWLILSLFVPCDGTGRNGVHSPVVRGLGVGVPSSHVPSGSSQGVSVVGARLGLHGVDSLSLGVPPRVSPGDWAADVVGSGMVSPRLVESHWVPQLCGAGGSVGPPVVQPSVVGGGRGVSSFLSPRSSSSSGTCSSASQPVACSGGLSTPVPWRFPPLRLSVFSGASALGWGFISPTGVQGCGV